MPKKEKLENTQKENHKEQEISAPNPAVSPPNPNYEKPGSEADNTDKDVYEGLVEALKEARNQRGDDEVQSKYQELLDNLVNNRASDKDLLTRSLNTAFATVFPGAAVKTQLGIRPSDVLYEVSQILPPRVVKTHESS